MRCEVCKKDVREVPLFRSKDVEAIWKCKKCLNSPPPSDVKGIVRHIQGCNT